MNWQTRLFTTFLCVFVAVPRLYAGASQHVGAGHKPVIAVIPVLDGKKDSESLAKTEEIGSLLGELTGFHVVDSKLTTQVLEYYDGTAETISANVREADLKLSKAKECYFNLRYEEASKEISSAISLFESEKNNISVTGPRLIDAYLSRAIIAKSRGNMKDALESLALALYINPKLEVTSEEYPPSFVSLFDKAKRVLGERPAGSISVSTNPEVAEIYLNGVRQGVTPLNIEGLPIGRYEIGIKANKYGTINRVIDIEDDKHLDIKEHLHWAKKDRSKKNMTFLAGFEVGEALKAADILKVDKVVFVNVDENKITAKMVDKKFGAGQPSVSGETPARIAVLLAGQAKTDLSLDAAKKIEPKGIGEPNLLSKNRRPIYKNPIFWSVVGAVIVGAIGGGVAMAMSGNGSPGGIGSVRLNFR